MLIEGRERERGSAASGTGAPRARYRLGDKGIIALTVLLSMAPPLCTDLYMSSLPTIAEELGASSALASLTMTIFFLCMAVGILVAGPLSDQHGRRVVLLIGTVATLAFSIACAFSTNIWFMLFCRVVQGLGAGAMVALSTAIIRDRFSGEKMAKVLSVTQALGMIAPMVAPLLGVAVLQFGSWRYEFIVLALLMLIAVLGACLLEETLPPEDRIEGGLRSSFGGFRVYLRDGFFVRLTLIGGLLYAPYMAYLAVASFIYIEFFGVSTLVFGIFFAVASAASVAGPVASMRLGGRGLGTSMRFVLVLAAIVSVVLLAAGTTAPLVFLACFMPFMFASTYSRPILTNALLVRATKNAGAASSLANFSFTAIGCVGMLAATAPWPDYIFGLGAITAIVTVLTAVLWLTRGRQSGA